MQTCTYVLHPLLQSVLVSEVLGVPRPHPQALHFSQWYLVLEYMLVVSVKGSEVRTDLHCHPGDVTFSRTHLYFQSTQAFKPLQPLQILRVIPAVVDNYGLVKHAF